MISKETATDLAMTYREIETAEKLLEEVLKSQPWREMPDIRDAFGRRVDGLQLGVPTGETGQRLFTVPWALCKPIIESHIASKRALISALNEKALLEAGVPQ